MTLRRKTRKGPSEHASETEVGTIARGNDKQLWIVKEFTNCTRRWVRDSGYLTHFNGDRPFHVLKEGNCIVVHSRKAHDYNNKYPPNVQGVYNTLVLTIPSFVKMFIGENTGKWADKHESAFPGNSILVHVSKDTYIYIGETIYKFSTSDKIKEYISVIGNSDVPYPFAIGQTNTYIMNDKVYIPNTKRNDKNPYQQYYEDNTIGITFKTSPVGKKPFKT